MIAERVKLRDFRSIESAEIELSEGVNVFLGNNGQGKTNALEGIYLMAAGKSFRTPRERELVRFGAESFEVTLDMRDGRREQELCFKGYGGESRRRRECRRNGAPIPRIAEFVGVFRAVLFCPEHLAIVKAGPSERRGFLDAALCQLRPVYLSALTRHNKVLSQRNALLKQLSEGEGEPALLEIYSEQLAREAAFLQRTRRAYISRLNGYVKQFFAELSEGSEAPELTYKNSIRSGEPMSEPEVFEAYARALSGNTAREIAAGATLYGSHKDDIEITLNGRDARLYASQGQQRSLALALKLGEGEISREYTGEYPVFLFDDVLSELDPRRQRFLLSRLGERQVIMTACTPPGLSDARMISVSGGHFERAGLCAGEEEGICTSMPETEG